VDQATLFDLMRTTAVSVSLSVYDGTPNTLLEAMHSGAFPVCGDLASIREWISYGKNGFLVDPANPQQVADHILAALLNEDLRREAAETNRQLVHCRADRAITREKAESLYQEVVRKHSR
jgi:glycosyltransferase involved in cell wall biosynthesis